MINEDKFYICTKRADTLTPQEISNVIELQVLSEFELSTTYRYNEADYIILLKRTYDNKIIGQAVIDTYNCELIDDLIQKDYRGRGLYKMLLEERIRVVELLFSNKIFYLFTEWDHLVNGHILSGLTKLPNKMTNMLIGVNGIRYDLPDNKYYHVLFIEIGNRYQSLFDPLTM